MSKYIGATVVNLSVDTVDVTGDITATDATPEVIIVNDTHEDTDGGREGKVTFKGQQSGGEETTLAEIQASHDGTSDDEKGDLIFKTNDGSDGASPTERLRIDSNGSILTATLGTDNVHLGEGAGDSIASGGNYNVTIGKDAGTAITTGDGNIAVGFEALKTEDANGKNIAIGYQALKVLDAGADGFNTVIGYQAGTSMSTGQVNTLIGHQAGDAMTTGNNNVAIGHEALGAEAQGDRNVAVGVGALQTQENNSDVDANNTAVGYNAGLSLTTALNNTVIGAGAGDAVTTGNLNTFVGSHAGSATDDGASNTAVGAYTLDAGNCADHNTAIGAGALGGSSYTGYDSTCVGSDAGNAVTSGYSNTFFGKTAGSTITTGNSNTIVGRYDGNQNGLDIRTSSNFIVLSDGAGNIPGHTTGADRAWKFMGNGASAEGITYNAHEFGHDNNDTQMMIMKEHHTSFASVLLDLRCARAASTAYDLLQGRSGGTSDTEFRVRGDGAVTSDNGFDGSGADYAEYFEWSDGNSDSQDRTGYTVVLDGEKIKLATSDDAAANVIGAVSVNPSVVGDSDILRWKQKYLKDDFGAYIFEDYNVEDNDGNTVVQQRRKLNPDYDEDKEYISREDRKEWATIGMMGKLRIRKGQPTGDRWIKMRDVSDTVEEWLVR